jgi:AraC-like DNA-binding protein
VFASKLTQMLPVVNRSAQDSVTSVLPEVAAELKRWTEAIRASRYQIALLAQRFGLSERQLRRQIRSRLHIGLKQFVDHSRAVAAARALINGATPKETAFSLNYHDLAHLHHALRGHLGLTPSQLIARRAKPSANTRRDVGVGVSIKRCPFCTAGCAFFKVCEFWAGRTGDIESTDGAGI